MWGQRGTDTLVRDEAIKPVTRRTGESPPACPPEPLPTRSSTDGSQVVAKSGECHQQERCLEPGVTPEGPQGGEGERNGWMWGDTKPHRADAPVLSNAPSAGDFYCALAPSL